MSEQETDRIEKAEAAALQWLSVLDEGRYAESWQNAALLLRNAANKSQFVQSLVGVLGSLGPLQKRESAHSTYYTELPGAPDGEYVVIQFNSSFENKEKAVETLTPMLDVDGKWRVSGYFVK